MRGGINANVGRMREMVDCSIAGHALNPYIGYEAATRLAAEALESGPCQVPRRPWPG